ncbi:hypothetical protein D3C84_1242970 [compost metagenome]
MHQLGVNRSLCDDTQLPGGADQGLTVQLILDQAGSLGPQPVWAVGIIAIGHEVGVLLQQAVL